MTTHEFAQKLLDGPNLPIFVGHKPPGSHDVMSIPSLEPTTILLPGPSGGEPPIKAILIIPELPSTGA